MNAMSLMIQQAAKFDNLSPEETAMLARKAQAGDTRAADKLVNHNLRLVVSIAKTFRNATVPMEDRVQEGTIGLMKAVQSYDPSKGAFTTHATPKVRHEIRRYIQNHANVVRIPVCQQDGRYDLSDAAADFRSMLDLDGPVGEDGETLGGVTGLADLGFADVDFRAAVATLDSREADILTLRYMMGETLQEVGDRYGFSRERARQIEAAALAKLREAMPAAA